MSNEQQSTLAFRSKSSHQFDSPQIPEQLRIVQRRDWSWVGGLPFLLAGLFCVVAPLLPALSNFQHLSWQTVGWSLFGMMFAGFGAVMVFGRSGAILDRKVWRLRRWWGMPFTIWTRNHSLEGFRQVRLDLVSDEEDQYFAIHVWGDEARVRVFDSKCYQQARVQAERLATFLGWDLHDLSSGEPVVREPAELQESLRDRLRRGSVAPTRPDQPEEIQSTCRHDSGSLSLEIPALGGRGAHRAMILTGQFVLGFLVSGLIYVVTQASVAKSGSIGDYYMVMGISLCVTLVGLWIGFTIIREGRKWGARTTSVSVDGLAMRLIHHSPYEEQSWEIEVDDLEELVIGRALDGISWGPGLALIARGDKKTLEFGLGLSREELEWMRDSINWTLYTQ